MTNPRYQIVLALTEEENKQLEVLKAKGIKIIDIFRKGLKKYQAKEE